MFSLNLKSSYLKNGIWIIFGNLTSQLSRLAFLMAMVRYFDKDFVGEFQIVITIIGLFSIFSLPGMGEAVSQSQARGYKGTYRLTNKWSFFCSILGSLILLTYAHISDLTIYVRSALIAGSLLFPFSNGLAGWQGVELGNSDFRRISTNQSIVNFLGYLLAIIYIVNGQEELFWLILLIKLPISLSNVYNSRRCLQLIPDFARPENHSIVYGLKVSAWSALNNIGNHIDKLLLAIFLNPAALASLVLAERFPEIIKKYIQSLRALLLPSLAKQSTYSPTLHRKLFIISLILSISILVFIVCILPWLFPLIFTTAYKDSILYSQLLCGTLILGQFAQTQVVFINSRFDSKTKRDITVGSNAIKILSSVLLIPQYGIMGAIISTACYRASTAIIVSMSIKRHRKNQIST